MANKFLIINQDIKEVDINTQKIQLINEIDIINKCKINNIEIDEIIRPKIYSIKSLIEYIEKCIYATQILPNFIRYIIINYNSDNIIKATNILNELYNLYNSLKKCNQSLISSKIEEYNKSFEIMYSKLIKSNINLKTNSNNYIKDINSREIPDFISQPEKNNFTIKESMFDDPFNPIIKLQPIIKRNKKYITFI